MSGGQAEEDPLSDEFFQARLQDLEARVSPKRLAHIKGVAGTCVMLAHEYGLDEKKARLAGVLHDWDKGYDDEGIRKRVFELGMQDEIDPWVLEHLGQVLHGPTAACALSRRWPQIPADVIRAIRLHTTASTDMHDLDKVLYVADAIEPSRQFGRIDELRALVGNATLDELYCATYEYWMFLLFERGKPVHPDTIRIWNDYAVKRAASKGKK
ncbi:MAG: bis(5'-nucleosyl)-tetraphosphatase (symmetrical) YqeK [Eggerthellaceae bacterium]|nr:bis(5'-nucleosyl)-tetraphosphatase (symmetrical) YqeK [Eggerthellaceae bacterium]